MMNENIQKILYTKEQIDAAAQKIAQQIASDYSETTPVLLTVLKGAVLWSTNVFSRLQIPAEIEFINVSSYHGGVASANKIELTTDLIGSVKDRDVIVVEDIVDTGQSLEFLVDFLKQREAKSIRVASMLNKQLGRTVDAPIVDYSGFEVGDEFVVGYGLDYKELYRNLPFVGVLKKEIYDKNEVD